MKRRISSILVLTFIMLLLLSILAGCGFGGKQVLVYRGMSITSAVSKSEARGYFSDGKDGFDYDKDNGNHLGHFKGDHVDKNEDVDEEDPFENGEDGESIEDEVSSSLNVVGSPVEIYYTTPGEDIYINIHIDNPDSFEIMSFTLNGQKYSSYMFEYGSDMENIILKYNVGYTSGIVEYTIDAIKYVDGTDIKDVAIGGDRTVKAGIRTDNQVTAEVSDVGTDTNRIALAVSLTDNDNLIAKSGGFIKAVLYNGESLVAVKDIEEGDNIIVFDSLETNTLYQYAIVGYYDDLSGSGKEFIIFEKDALYTDAVVLFDNIAIGREKISFALLWNVEHPTKLLTSLNIYKGDTLLQTLAPDATVAEGLISDNTYTLVAEYDNAGKSESIYLEFTTAKRAVPSFALVDTEISSDGICAGLQISNDDSTLADYKVEIYRDNVLVAESDDGEICFTSLLDYTDYELRISYSFDLGDGNGLQTKIYKYAFKTHPYVDVTSCDIINTSGVSEGETIYMQLNLDNPNELRVTSVIIDGAEYEVTGSSTKTKVFVEIVYNGQFSGGDTALSVDKINVVADRETISVSPRTEASDNVFINGVLGVIRAEIVNSDFEPVDWAFPSEELYVLLTLDNSTGYIIDSVDSSSAGLTRLDDNRWYYRLPIGSGLIYRDITSIAYHNEYVNKTITLTDINTGYCYVVASDTTHYVSTPDDLKSMSDGYYYEMTGDIDLSGLEWNAADFYGVFNARGYSVKNMSFVGSVKNKTAYFGLFGASTGVIENLTIENATIIADVSADDDGYYVAHCGAIAAHGGTLILLNCTVDADTSISINNRVKDCYVGGIVGSCSNAVISGCENYGSISAVSVNSAIAGGIVGSVAGIYSRSVVSSSANYGEITASGGNGAHVYVGGIVGSAQYETYLTVENCVNTAYILANDGQTINVGGILASAAGYSHIILIDTVNMGIIDSNVLYQNLGGMIGIESTDDLMVENCYSIISGYGVGGIHCTVEQLSDKEFYTETLGWSEDIWDLTDLDVEAGKFPKLK